MDNILKVERIDNQQLSFYGYIYLTTNLINGKKYIGAHRAVRFDESYKGSGKLLWKAIDKYGWDNFKTEIIEWCSAKEELFKREKEIIAELKCVESNDYYNIADGGNGGCVYKNLDIDSYNKVIKKISDSKKNRKLTLKEKEHLDQMHKDWSGNHHTEESKLKSRNSNLGQKRSKQTIQKMKDNHADFSGKNNPFFNKAHSEESKSKISKNNARRHKGKIWITNKIDDEILIYPEMFSSYPSYVRGRLRKNQRRKFND